MKMNIALIIIGAILVIIGCFRQFISSPDKRTNAEIELGDGQKSDSKFQPSEESEHSYADNKSESVYNKSSKEEDKKDLPIADESKKKGNDFEAFTADMLKACGVRIKEWHQGTITDEGAYAEDIFNPDFFLEHKFDGRKLEYWLECKFRSEIPERGFELDEKQIGRYKAKQGESKKKVLIFLGVGGSAKNPNSFYLIPVDSLARYKHIPQKYLEKYRLNSPRQNFNGRIKGYFFEEVFNKK